MKIAIVTGASSGLGREFARQLDSYGFEEIWLIARRAERMKELSSELITDTRILSLDLTKSVSFDVLRFELNRTKPVISLLVNAAGFGTYGDMDEVKEDETEKMIDLNIKALVKMVYVSKQYFVRGSRIINVASCASFSPLPYFNIYASTKAFVRHFSLALSEELKNDGIFCTAVCPLWVKTEFIEKADMTDKKHRPRVIFPVYKAENVVHTAIRDSLLKRKMSVCGVINQSYRIASKIIPPNVMMKAWDIITK